MFREIPVISRICFNKEIARSWRSHERNMREIKPTVDSRLTPSRVKRTTRAADRRAKQIHFENQHLIKRLEQIHEKESAVAKNSPRPAAKNMRKARRKLEAENDEILRRIKQQKSSIDFSKFEADRRKTEQNINLISQFPYKGYPKNKTCVNFWLPSSSTRVGALSQDRKEDYIFKEVVKRGHEYFEMVVRRAAEDQVELVFENIENEKPRYFLQIPSEKFNRLLYEKFKGDMHCFVDAIDIDQGSRRCFVDLREGRKGEAELGAVI